MSAAGVSGDCHAALIVIDVQESFRHMPYWSDVDLPAFRAALLRLEAGCRQRGVPVLHVFHVEPSGPFSMASGHVRALDWLPGSPDACFFKHAHNAFSDTGLDLHLRRLRVDRLLIAGIRTEQCCETTARVGSDIGYAVDFVIDATLTFAMTHPRDGRSFSPAEIREHCELVLAGRFARVIGVDECLLDLGESDA
ncbi:MAG TPA: isochorismatase family protein [Candidatus Accumulibacter phosphatis]|mgnify:CR=1 FL=1|nr:MAG: putative hydrolase [Candidatus Accumulibacter sp. SK-11]HAY27105.1 cysteine hydrolase [Accumulibacter sp.]HCV12667.1 cysteine hydrolase [Accumulibacter sp.]HRL78011.1 isochorismatase family protein [Candidatus Accumulibacter phosphatis]HRQ96686.1 isochorismatase family protein [Candidatus Accumulibacter phosphatis]